MMQEQPWPEFIPRLVHV